MQDKSTNIETELTELITNGVGILANSFDEKGKFKSTRHKILPEYQEWYTESLAVIKQLIPERYDEFVEKYQTANRKSLSSVDYTISDFLNGIRITNGAGKEKFDHANIFLSRFSFQLAILKSAQAKIGSLLTNIKGTLHADLFDSELDASKELLKNGFHRAAGALAGVTLEKHLSSLCKSHNIQITKTDPSISDFNDELKKNLIHDIPIWRNVQRLGDLRNLCVHNKTREPTESEVEEFINGTDKFIKTVH